MTEPNSPFNSHEIRKSVEKLAVTSAAAMALGRPLLILANLGGAMVLARLIAPHEYGLFGMVIVAVRMAEVFREMGLGTVAIQREHLTAEQQAGLFWTNAFFAMFIGGVLALSAPLIVQFYGEPALTGLTFGVALQFVVNGWSTQHLALIKRQLNFKGLVIVQVSAALLAVLAAVIAALQDWGAYALVLRTLVEAAVNAIGLRLLTRWSPGLPRGFSSIIEELKFGMNVTFANMAAFLSRQADNIIVGKYFGAESLGAYQKSYELMMMSLQHIGRPAAGIAVSALSRLNGEPENYKRAYFRMVEKILLLSTPFAVMLIGAPEIMVGVLLGHQWTAVVPLARVFGFVALLQPLSTTTGWLLMTQNQTPLLFRGSVFNAVLDLAGFAIGARWGPVGIALSYSAGQLIKVPFGFWYQLRAGHVRPSDMYKAIAVFLAPGLVAASVVYGLAQAVVGRHVIVGLLCTGTTAIVVYFGLIWMIPRGRKALRDVLKASALLRS